MSFVDQNEVMILKYVQKVDIEDNIKLRGVVVWL